MQSRSCKYYPTLITGLFLLVQWTALYGQLSVPGKPYPLNYLGLTEPVVFTIPVSATLRMQAGTDETSSLLKRAGSGLLIDVDFTPQDAGVWDTLQDGTRLWRAGFHIEEASMLSLIFSPYQLHQGVKLYIYDRHQEIITGAFTHLNNKTINMLATSPIPGDMVMVEMQVPAYLESYGNLEISGVGCDFRNTFKTTTKDEWFGASGVCNIDIGCLDDPVVRSIKNSVVRIVFLGHERCTGTLVNTTQNMGANYILTAGHCFTRESEANSAVFYFGYESPFCEGPDGNSLKSISGSTIRARSSDVDFALVELLEPIPFSYHPYYAGWDHSGAAPSESFVIHHPLGDVKKFASEDHAVSVSSFGNMYNDNTHWLVERWETGTTEAGSSGAPLFGPNGRIIGTLTGGLAKCENPINDYFQMFSHSWKDYPAPENQLAVWLDPLKTNWNFLEGIDPYAGFRESGDTLSNILESESFTALNAMLAWGSYSGHNSLFTTAFAERFTSATGKKILGLLIYVEKNYVARSQRTLQIKVWKGSALPGEVVYEKTVPLSDLAPDAMNFIEFDSFVPVDPTFFAGYELNYESPQDTFSTYMADRQGNLNTAFIYDGNQWSSLSDYTSGSLYSSFAVFPVVYDSLPKVEHFPQFDDEVIAWPNPASSVIHLMFREMKEEPVHIAVFNLQGQLVIEKDLGPWQHMVPLDLAGIAGGIYVIGIKQGKQLVHLKVAVVK
jgi:hypothetical protein